eukprot:scaffold118707_cov63-Phaeocystis_antarctica.AAC.6
MVEATEQLLALRPEAQRAREGARTRVGEGGLKQLKAADARPTPPSAQHSVSRPRSQFTRCIELAYQGTALLFIPMSNDYALGYLFSHAHSFRDAVGRGAAAAGLCARAAAGLVVVLEGRLASLRVLVEDVADLLVERLHVAIASFHDGQQLLAIAREVALCLEPVKLGEGLPDLIGAAQAVDHDVVGRAAHAQEGEELHDTPEPLAVGLAGKHDERAAARQEDGERGQVGVDIVLVDARLVEPHQRLLSTVCSAQLLGPHLQLRVLGVAVVLPRVRDERIHCAQLGRLRAAEHLGVAVVGEVICADGVETECPEALRPLSEHVGGAAATDEGGDRRRLLLVVAALGEPDQPTVRTPAVTACRKRGREQAGEAKEHHPLGEELVIPPFLCTDNRVQGAGERGRQPKHEQEEAHDLPHSTQRSSWWLCVLGRATRQEQGRRECDDDHAATVGAVRTVTFELNWRAIVGSDEHQAKASAHRQDDAKDQVTHDAHRHRVDGKEGEEQAEESQGPANKREWHVASVRRSQLGPAAYVEQDCRWQDDKHPPYLD